MSKKHKKFKDKESNSLLDRFRNSKNKPTENNTPPNSASNSYPSSSSTRKYYVYENGEMVEKTGSFSTSPSTYKSYNNYGYHNYGNYGKSSSYDSYDRNYKPGEYFKENQGHSNYWTSSFSYSGMGWGSSSFSDNEKLKTALDTISRTVHVLGSGKMKEQNKEFAIQFSKDGRVSEYTDYFLSPVIELDRRIVLDDKKDLSEVQRTDILCGEALKLSGVRLTITDKLTSRNYLLDRSKSEAHRILYCSAELDRTKKFIGEETPGYKPYLVANSSFHYNSELHEELISKEKAFGSAIYSIAQSLCSQELEVNYGEYKEDVDYFKNLIQFDTSTRDLIKSTNEAIKYLKEKYNVEDPPQDPDDPNSPPMSDGMNPELNGVQSPEQIKGLLGNQARASSDEALLKANSDKVSNNNPNGADKEPTARLTYEMVKVEHTTFVDSYKRKLISATSGSSAIYNHSIEKMKNAIDRLKASIELIPVESSVMERGLKSGYLDEGSLDKLTLNSPLIFERRDIIEHPRISVTILVDESGSMAGRRAEEARDVAIALYETFNSKEGVQVGVYGHTTTYSGDEDNVIVYKYITPTEGNPISMASMRGRNGNMDAVAIDEVAKDIQTWAKEDNYQNLLFVLSDGAPCHEPEAIKAVSDKLTKSNIQVYGIGIDRAYSSEEGNRMYGTGRFVVLNDVTSCAPIIGSFVSNLLGGAN